MAEQSDSQKTEQPTTKKKEDARKEGQTLQSKDLTLLSAIICIFAYYIINARNIAQILANLYMEAFNMIKYNYNPSALIFQAIDLTGELMITPIMIGAVFSLIVNVVQMGGIVLAVKRPFWDPARMNIVQNLKNIFSKKNMLLAVKHIIEVVIMIYVTWIITTGELKSMLLVIKDNILIGIEFFNHISGKLLLFILLIYFIFALFEYVIEAIILKKKLMMSLQEVKQEYKESEGSQEVKWARRRFHKELLEENRDLDKVNFDATMVVSNPTHIAIVLHYSPKKSITPILVLKASGHAATVVFSYAKRKKIPIIKHIWLAQQLYQIGIPGRPTPPSLSIYLVELFRNNIHLFPHIVEELKEVLSKMQTSGNAPDKPAS